MSPHPRTTPVHPRVERWDRIGLGIRCGYNPAHPPVLHTYLEAGRALARHGLMDEITVQWRMCRLLLQTAGDHALPRLWRQACAEQLTRPLARLTTLLRERDPARLRAIDRAVQTVQQALLPDTLPRNRTPRA